MKVKWRFYEGIWNKKKRRFLCFIFSLTALRKVSLKIHNGLLGIDLGDALPKKDPGKMICYFEPWSNDKDNTWRPSEIFDKNQIEIYIWLK